MTFISIVKRVFNSRPNFDLMKTSLMAPTSRYNVLLISAQIPIMKLFGICSRASHVSWQRYCQHHYFHKNCLRFSTRNSAETSILLQQQGKWFYSVETLHSLHICCCFKKDCVFLYKNLTKTCTVASTEWQVVLFR